MKGWKNGEFALIFYGSIRFVSKLSEQRFAIHTIRLWFDPLRRTSIHYAERDIRRRRHQGFMQILDRFDEMSLPQENIHILGFLNGVRNELYGHGQSFPMVPTKTL